MAAIQARVTTNGAIIPASVQRESSRPRRSRAVPTGTSSTGVVIEPRSCHRSITLCFMMASAVAKTADTHSPMRE